MSELNSQKVDERAFSDASITDESMYNNFPTHMSEIYSQQLNEETSGDASKTNESINDSFHTDMSEQNSHWKVDEGDCGDALNTYASMNDNFPTDMSELNNQLLIEGTSGDAPITDGSMYNNFPTDMSEINSQQLNEETSGDASNTNESINDSFYTGMSEQNSHWQVDEGACGDAPNTDVSMNDNFPTDMSELNSQLLIKGTSGDASITDEFMNDNFPTDMSELNSQLLIEGTSGDAAISDEFMYNNFPTDMSKINSQQLNEETSGDASNTDESMNDCFPTDMSKPNSHQLDEGVSGDALITNESVNNTYTTFMSELNSQQMSEIVSGETPSTNECLEQSSDKEFSPCVEEKDDKILKSWDYHDGFKLNDSSCDKVNHFQTVDPVSSEQYGECEGRIQQNEKTQMKVTFSVDSSSDEIYIYIDMDKNDWTKSGKRSLPNHELFMQLNLYFSFPSIVGEQSCIKGKSLYRPLSLEAFIYVVVVRGPTMLPPDLEPYGLPPPDLPGVVTALNPSRASGTEVPPREREADHRRGSNNTATRVSTSELRMCHISDGNTSASVDDAGLDFISIRDNRLTISLSEESNQLQLTTQERNQSSEHPINQTVQESYMVHLSSSTETECQVGKNEEMMLRHTIFTLDGERSSLPPATVRGSRWQDTESGLSMVSEFCVSPDVPEEMREQRSRAQTFGHNWPHHFLTGEDMANAGLYYTGIDDITRCLSCGNCMRDWKEGDNPQEEHMRLYPHCSFARRRKRDGTVNIRSDVPPDLDAEGATANGGAEEIRMLEIEEKDADDPKRDGTVNIRSGVPPDLYAEGATANGGAEEIQMFEIEENDADDPIKRHPYPELASDHNPCNDNRSESDVVTTEIHNGSMIRNKERTGAPVHDRTGAGSINSIQTTERIEWKEQPGGVHSTARVQRKVLDNQEESQEFAGMIRNEEREGTHQVNGESRRVVTTREMTTSKRQAISSDQTTQRGVWQEEPDGVQDTVRVQRNDLENQEDSQGSAGSYSLSDRIKEFLQSSDGTQLLNKGYTAQHITDAVEAYSLNQRIAVDEPITMCTVWLALQSLSARPRRNNGQCNKDVSREKFM